MKRIVLFSVLVLVMASIAKASTIFDVCLKTKHITSRCLSHSSHEQIVASFLKLIPYGTERMVVYDYLNDDLGLSPYRLNIRPFHYHQPGYGKIMVGDSFYSIYLGEFRAGIMAIEGVGGHFVFKNNRLVYIHITSSIDSI